MKSNKLGLKLPIKLDLIGTVSLGLGLVKVFGGMDFMPENMRFDNHGLALILLGVLLMMPLLIYILGWVLAQFKH